MQAQQATSARAGVAVLPASSVDIDDLLSRMTHTSVVPLVFQPRPKNDFQPVILAQAPDEVLAMPEGTLHEKVLKAKAVMAWSMERFEHVFSYSAGKDSSALLSISLSAAVQLKAQGKTVKRFMVLTSNTGVENPEVLGVVRSEQARVRGFIDAHDLPGFVATTAPYLMSEWAVNIIGGKTLISTPVTNRNCTTNLKSVPLNRARKQFFGQNDVPNGHFTVGATGVRFSESVERAENMEKRAESPVQIVQTSAAQDVFLAPIALWSTDEVMEFIGLAVNDHVLPDGERLPLDLYSDLAEVWRIYKDAEGGECTVGSGGKPSNGCSPRHGCFVCTLVSADKSMDALTTQEQYGYMAPLGRFRNYLNNTVFDLDKRIWIGRSIIDGHIAFGPDAYSPEYVQDLLRYALTIDRDEEVAAAALGIAPRFQIVSKRALIAIDALWSQQAYTLPFAALAIFHEVYIEGKRFDVPVVAKVPKTALPPTRYIPVQGWDEDALDDFSGMRNALLEMVGTATHSIEATGQSRQVMAVNTGPMFDVHDESADMILMFELDRLVARYHEAAGAKSRHGFSLVGEGYKFYLQFGAISLAKSQVGEADSILRRSSWRERHGLAGYNYDRDKAFAMSLAHPLPVEARKRPIVPTAAEVRQHERKSQRLAVRGRRISLGALFREWAPDVAWHRAGKLGLTLYRLPANCIHKEKGQYSSGRRKGWALHHCVHLGDLVEFLRNNPELARRVVSHRSLAARPGLQLSLFAA
jgi:DNA sulfur modification protein DndC